MKFHRFRLTKCFINSKILTNIFYKISVFMKLQGGNNENYRCEDGEIFH